MVIYFADRRMNTLGLATTELQEGFSISDDLKTEDTDTGVATFECTIHWTDATRALAKECTAAGNYLLRSNNNENEFYTIIEVEEDTKNQTIYIYAEDAGMDLLNETVGAFAADEAHPIAWYIEKYAIDTGFEIGLNEISDLSRKLEWTGEATSAERIASVATQFDNAEISYSFEIKGLTITHKYINIHKKRGKDAGVQLRLNREVDRIVTTTSVADLATSLYVTGGTPEGEDNPINIQGFDYDDGDFYVMDTEPRLNSRNALAIWSRYVWAKEPNQLEGYTGHIIKQWSYDTDSVSELVNRAITQLKKVCEPAVNYEIDIQQLPENVGIGDYIDIVDENGELYLSSRILKLETSVCDQKQTATLGEFLIKDSGISQTVRELAEQFEQLAKSRQFYVWIVYADDANGNGISLDPTGKKYMGTCTTSAGATPDLSDPSIYKWSLIQGGDGVGITEIITWYGVSDSPYDVPTEWVEDPYGLLRNQYQWSYTETHYSDGSVDITSPHIIAYYDYLEVDELTARVATIEEAYVTYEEVELLVAGEIQAEIIEAGFVTTEYLEANYIDARTIETTYLTADSATIIDLTAALATIEEAYIDKATIDELLAKYASIEYLEAYYIDAKTIEANYLQADSAVITDLTAFAANIYTLLGGEGAFGELDAVHLTTDNAVIDTAVIIEAVAGTILADLIYANYINTNLICVGSEDGSLWIEGSTLWIKDANGNYRIQIGEDGYGDYNLALWDADGNCMWNATGATEYGINDGAIKDIAVADDANISGYKLNIEEICSIINSDGQYEIDASSVTISGTTLDAWYASITQQIDGLEGLSMEGLIQTLPYFCLWESDVDAPPADEDLIPAICGEAVCGQSVCGVTDGTLWVPYDLQVVDGLYKWIKWKGFYADGHEEWGDPYCLTDGYLREQTTVLQTELEVVQGQISAKIWMTDITETIETTMTDVWSELNIWLGGIEAEVGEVTTIVFDAQSAAKEAQEAADLAQKSADDAQAAVDAAQAEYDALKAQADATDEELAAAQEKLEKAQANADAAQAAADAAQEAADAAKNNSVVDLVAYFCLWVSATEPPPDNDSLVSAICGQATCGQAICGVTDTSTYWTTEEPVADEGEYKWIKYLLIYGDGHTEWGDPYCLTDGVTREKIEALYTSYTILESRISDLVITAEGITSTVAYVQQYMSDLESSINAQFSVVEQTTDSIISTVGSVQSDVTNLEGKLADGVESATEYFCLWISDTTAPPDDDSLTPAICGEATCGQAICGVTGSYWTTTEPTAGDGQYKWIKYLYTFIDGHTEWGDPYCLTDGYARGEVQAVYSQIEQLAGSIKLSVTNGALGDTAFITLSVDGDDYSQVIDLTRIRQAFVNDESSIVIAAGIVAFAANTFRVDADNLTITEDGSVYATNAYFENAYLEGTIESGYGHIGGWSITSNAIYYGTSSMTSTTQGTFIGSGTSSTSGIRQYYSSSKYVNISQGVLTAYGGVFSGTITASEGEIGGFTIKSGYLYNQSHSSFSSSVDGVYMGTNGISLGANFSVSETGQITAKSGTIGDFNISGGALTSNTVYLSGEKIQVGSGFDISTSGVGHIGNWVFLTNKIYNDLSIYNKTAVMQAPHDEMYWVFAAGGESHDEYGDCPFRVSKFGELYASSATFDGTTWFQGAGMAIGHNTGTGCGIWFSSYNNTSSLITGMILTQATIDGTAYNNAFSLGSSSYPLQIYGNGIWLYSTNYVHIGNLSLGISSSSNMGMYDWGNERWLIYRDSSGRTCLGNTNASTILYGSNVYLNGTSTAVTSDMKLKNNVELFTTEDRALFDNLTPREYKSTFDPKRLHMGFVAQEIEDAMKAAGLDPDDYGLTDSFEDEDGETVKAIRYEEIIPLLVYEVQQLKAELNKLKGATA